MSFKACTSRQGVHTFRPSTSRVRVRGRSQRLLSKLGEKLFLEFCVQNEFYHSLVRWQFFWWVIVSVKFPKKTNGKRTKKLRKFLTSTANHDNIRVWNNLGEPKNCNFVAKTQINFVTEVTIHRTTEKERSCCRRFFSIRTVPTSKKFPLPSQKSLSKKKKCTVYSSCVCETKSLGTFHNFAKQFLRNFYCYC